MVVLLSVRLCLWGVWRMGLRGWGVSASVMGWTGRRRWGGKRPLRPVAPGLWDRGVMAWGAGGTAAWLGAWSHSRRHWAVTSDTPKPRRAALIGVDLEKRAASRPTPASMGVPAGVGRAAH